LRDVSATQIDLAILTHSDADHLDGLIEYTRSPGHLPIALFWGPCTAAFRRHAWLFPQRINRGLDALEAFQTSVARHTSIVFPVEGAQWISPDRDLVVRVLSPAGRLIERLLVGDDSDDLFLRFPTPLGWLLDLPPPPDPEDPYFDLRAALSSGQVLPDAIPTLPAPRRTINTTQAGELARQAGVDPEFFGNNVLNDTSIVVLIEARLGEIRRRVLLTGDLENFTYLMAVHPNGLGSDIVKAPHHGSRPYIESTKARYDEVWQWLRPKAALVSANGKHRLPRKDFRDAVLRYGATLFCTCRRSREILLGSRNEESCHSQFGCGARPQGSVGIALTEDTIESDAVACASGSVSGVVPIIQMVQHTIQPSNLLDRFTENELRLHATWVARELRIIHDARRESAKEPGLSAVSMDALRGAAVAAGRYAAAANIEMVLERAARDGVVWLTPPARFRSGDRKAWVMPSESEWSELENWIASYLVIQLAVAKREVGLVPRELLLAADTGYLARRAATKFALPPEIFSTAIWPRLSIHLQRRRHIATRHFARDDITAVVALPAMSMQATYAALTQKLPCVRICSFMQKTKVYQSEQFAFKGAWPEELADIVAPFWQGTDRLIPHELLSPLEAGYSSDDEWNGPDGIRSYASKESCDAYWESMHAFSYTQRHEISTEVACAIFAASLICRLHVLARAA
jgi:hypothetical protein